MLLEKEIDIWKIDDWDVAGLVRILNRIPGISTIGSCQGHIETFYPIQSEGFINNREYIPADHNKVFLRGGFITFYLDESFPETRSFKKELTRYARTKPHINFGIYEYKPQIVYLLDLVLDDLLKRYKKFPNTDPYAVIKNECQLTLKDALQRHIEWYMSILDITRIAEKYQR